MLSLLNAVDFFGKTLERWNATVAKGLLITAVVLLSIIAVALLVYLFKLLNDTRLHTDQRDDETPYADDEQEDEPDYEQEIEPSVQDMIVSSEVALQEEDPAPQAEVEQTCGMIEPVDDDEIDQMGRLRYDKSFTARLIQSEDKVKSWYTDIKNELLCYKKVSHRMSWHRETFRYHREPVARLVFRGKTLCLLLSLDFSDYADKYHVEDMSDIASYAGTPLMIRLKNNRRVNNAKLLIGKVMEHKDIQRLKQPQYVDYYMPYQDMSQLIEKGLIKSKLTSRRQEAFLTRQY